MFNRRLYFPLLLFILIAAFWAFSCAGKRPSPEKGADDFQESGVVGRVPVAGLRVGAALADITPKGNVWMAGLRIFRRSRGVHDRLYAHALVIEAGDATIRLVSLDLVGMMADKMAGFRDKLWNPSTDPPPIIACTHTHSGPDTLGLWGGVPERYKRFLGEQVVKAVREAEESAVDAGVYAGMGRFPDGTVKNIRQTDLLDLEVGALQFRRSSDGKPIATLVNFAAHPEVLWSDNRLLSADYPQYIYRDIEADGGGTPLFFNAALGAMVTPDAHSLPMGEFVHTFEEAERVASLMMKGVRQAIASAVEIKASEIEWRREVFAVPAGYPMFKTVKKLGLWTRPILEGDKFITEMDFLRMGPVKIITFPGEPNPRLGLDVKSVAGTPYTFIIALANDELGYLLPRHEYENPLYSYEVTVSPGPEAAEIILEKALEMVR